MSSWTAWLGFTPEQMEVLARVLGVQTQTAQLTPEQGVLTAGAGTGQSATFALKYGIIPPAQKPMNVNMLYGIAPATQPGVVRVILTDKQKADLKGQGVTSCDYFDVAPSIVMKYGIAPVINNQPAAISPMYGITIPVK